MAMQLVLTLVNVGIFAIGLILLIYGSNVFVESASRFAKEKGVSELFIGLTIVAIGTSLPEIFSSSVAIIEGHSELAFTNVMGSTLVNMTLIIGLSAVVSPLASNAVVIDRDAKIMILILGVLAATLLDPFTPGVIVFWEGSILLLLFFAYLSFLFTRREECESCYQFHVFVDYLIRLQFLTSLRGLALRPKQTSTISDSMADESATDTVVSHERRPIKEIMLILLSVFFVLLGAQFVVSGSEFITYMWGVQQGVIGLVIVALSTSLPELTVSVNSAKRGFGRLLIGNVIGSNIVNITLGLGLIPIIIPANIGLHIGNVMVLLFILGIAFAFFYVIRKDWRVTRREGFALIFLYIIAQIVLIFFSQFSV
ncbi:MAG: calcium/sodium antiporter [Candidatus Thorarchaeota archaeon]